MNENDILSEDVLTKYVLWSDKIASFSKDQSTKVGAVFLNKQNKPRSFGYNGMPRGLDDNHPERNERPEKYLWYEHAERNAIYNIARELLEGNIMFSTKFPNMEGGRAIVSSGISKVIINFSPEQEEKLNVEDKKMNERVTQLFNETGVQLVKINRNEIEAGFSPYDLEINNQNLNEKMAAFNLKEKYLKYLDMIQDYANEFSPDREEKNGCMILNGKTLNPIDNGFGVNAPPSTIKITEEMHTPEEKKFWFQEAEKNAIFNSVREKFEGTTAIASWCPCTHCQLAMASVAMEKVVTRKLDFNKESDMRWKESFDRSIMICDLANIELVLLDVPKPDVMLTTDTKKKKKF